MPKRYSEQERIFIKKRLKEEAADCMARFGIRRTTVDEIVKRVKIPKGTFYLFYPSKELLLFDVILEQHECIEQKLYQSICKIDPSTVSADQLTDVFFEVYQMMAELPIINLIQSDEMEWLARKLPQDVVAGHLQHDNDWLQQVLSRLPVKEGIDSKTVCAAFRALYFSTLHREEIGEAHYEQALRALIYGLVTQLL